MWRSSQLGELGELGDRGGQLGEEAASEIPRRTDRTRSAQNPSPNAQMLPSLLGVLIQYKTRNSGALRKHSKYTDGPDIY